VVEINEEAPEFCLKNQNNKDVCLKDFSGKWVVVYFYPKDNTPGCTLEARYFSINAKKFEQKNAQIIGISADSIDSHKKFECKHDLTIDLLSDPDHKTIKNYGVWKPKKMFGKEFMGIVRSTFLINPEGKLAYIWPKVKVTGHIDEVYNKIMEKKK
jgi:peroxiredoxin Q/BCP